jgi:hypothetical protein
VTLPAGWSGAEATVLAPLAEPAAARTAAARTAAARTAAARTAAGGPAPALDQGLPHRGWWVIDRPASP